MDKFSFKRKLQLIAALILIVVAAESVSIFSSVNEIRSDSEKLLNQDIKVLNDVHRLKLSVVQVQQWLTDISATRALDGLDDGFVEAENNARLFRQIINDLKVADPENVVAYEAMAPVFEKYYATGKQMAQAYIDEGPEGGNRMMAEFDAAAEAMSDQVDTFLRKTIQLAEADSQHQISAIDELRMTTMLATGALVLAIFLSFWIGRSHLRFLGNDPEKIKAVADKIARGDLSANEGEAQAKGLFASLSVMRQRLSEQMQEISRQSQENGSVKTTLDNVTSPVMMLDNGLRVMYLNQAAREMLGKRESAIRQQATDFSVATIEESDVRALFAQKPSVVRALEQNSVTCREELVFGETHIRLITTPVKDCDGQPLGTAVELIDRTEEVATEKEIAQMVQSASEGNLELRISREGKNSFFLELADGMNTLMERIDSVFGALEGVLSRMAHGDFSHTLNGEYSGTFGVIQRDVNSTMVKLSDALEQLRLSVGSLQLSSSNITNSNDQLSTFAQRQADDLEQVATAMEQIASTVKHNADKAQEVRALSVDASELVVNSQKVVTEAVESMEVINESSSKIREIIGVIDEIAFQTNLLALNASVEAARAGEQGRGFAVVASEVRNLASRSATAAHEIKQLIEDSVSKVDVGTRLVNRSGETLHEIVGKIEDITILVGDIASANQQQSAGVSSVNQRILSIDKLTQNNALLARDVFKTSETMAVQAEESNRMMAFFK